MVLAEQSTAEAPPRFEFSRGKVKIVRRDDGSWVKLCADCRSPFPLEWNSRGQRTSRKLCDKCRIQHACRKTLAGDLPLPPGTPRCAECTAVVGIHLGGVSHLDAAGNCPECARWLRKDGERRARIAAGYRLKGGMWVVGNGFIPPAGFVDALRRAASAWGYTLPQIYGADRHADISRFRHQVACLLRGRTNWSLAQIGVFLGGRHHTTIMNSIEQGEIMGEVDPDILAAFGPLFPKPEVPSGPAPEPAPHCPTCNCATVRRLAAEMAAP